MPKPISTSYEIAKNLFLVRQTIGATAPKAIDAPTNHLAVIDCSGSMAGDLPRIREQLKRRLPNIMRDGDTLSLIWFSGKGQCGALLEAEPVATLADLSDVNRAIDRWLRPIGLTGFKEPLIEVEALIGRVAKKNANPFALFFMSDGCDNQWPRAEILKVVEKAAGKLACARFVEYGYYADRPLLAAMAEKAGGQLIFAEDFDRYVPMFDAAMTSRAIGGKRIEAKISGDPIGGFAYVLDPAERALVTYEASTGKAYVPEGTAELWYLSPSRAAAANTGEMITTTAAQNPLCGTEPSGISSISAAYAAMSLYAVRMKPDVVYPILKALGDVSFIEQFATCFGKQRYSEFMDNAKHAAFDHGQRYLKGYDPSKVPADDAFTVLHLLRMLNEDDSTRILLDHPQFKYSRISRGRVNADENLSAAESEALEAVRAKMAGEKSAKKLKELQGELDALLAKKQDALVFVATPEPNGYPIANLTYNETRPNISVLVKKQGTVDLSSRDAPKPIGALFGTFIFRNYAIVKDGLVNVEELPVTISKTMLANLKAANVQLREIGDSTLPTSTVVISLRGLPILNRKMVDASVSAKALVELEYSLTCLRAAQKVFNTYQKELFPGAKLKGWIEEYGAEATAWLKEQGLTEYSGFNPKMVQAEAKDFYMGKELDVKIKGLSSLPSVKEVKEKMAGSKALTGGAALMAPLIKEVEEYFKKNPKHLHEKWLTGLAQATTARVRGQLWQSAQIKFGVIVGQVWFTEFKSLDENKIALKINGTTVEATLALREIEIEV